MKIKNANIEYSNGSVVLKYPISPAELLAIKTQHLYNFQENFFEVDLPTTFNEGFIAIIAEQHHADNFKQGEDFELIPSKWNILRFEADKKKYETFFSLRREGKIPGTLDEALVNFSIKRATQGQDLSKESEGHLKDVMSDIVELGVNNKMDDDNLENIIGGFISKVGGEVKIDLSAIIEDYLSSNEIPIDKENDCYYFTVIFNDDSWNVEIGTSDDGHKLIIYSSVSYQSAENITGSLLEDINHLNFVLKDGHLEIDIENQLLYLKTEVELNLFKIDVQLKKLIDANFESMKTILPVLKEKHNQQISFSS
jgi:hypothetical protein